MSAKKSTDRVVWDDVTAAPDHLELPDEAGAVAVGQWVERLREFRAVMASLDRVVVIGYDEGGGDTPGHLWVGSIPKDQS